MRRKPARTIDLRMLSMLGILVVMWTLFRLKTGDYYFGGDSIANLSRDMATWTILAGGMTLIIVAGHIDLSVGSLLALTAATCAYLINDEYGCGWSATLAVPVTLLIGLAIGLYQGFLVAYFRIPAFIVTLAGLFMFRGITQKISARDPRVPDESWVSAFGFQHLPPTAGWCLAGICCAGLGAWVWWGRKRRRSLGIAPGNPVVDCVKVIAPGAALLLFVYKVNQARGIPLQTLVMACALGGVHFIARYTRFGRRVFAVGGNPQAARLSGVNVERTTLGVFALMGLMTGLAGVLWMAQNQGSTKNAGTFYELYAIAACVIGGTSLMGGRGSILGTFLGGLVMATVIQGMDYTDLENWLQLVVRGGVVAIAVGIDVASKDPAPWMRRLAETARFRRRGDPETTSAGD
ncbi:MAG: sugar ABC transporter permease [Lentisphaerae bacterium]|jgi:D-xylose transport system permease protein|nr:sugar ABC transporter permease [Lentisphaerota bacterium]MBT4816985.1 sugar ABC transporter permease [Lentisphaerota bacterium]MBT5608642.1 sugar ABC transporter permease [Lentisphaerota bacterium]MBT7057941.1 sugar ABC transporter permease [Lentisphaerota bacterium]MBT7841612.1 sugar ABC transporter permease [Lentisphaerota bacterium]